MGRDILWLFPSSQTAYFQQFMPPGVALLLLVEVGLRAGQVGKLHPVKTTEQ